MAGQRWREPPLRGCIMHSRVKVSSEGQWLALARTRFEALYLPVLRRQLPTAKRSNGLGAVTLDLSAPAVEGPGADGFF